MIITRADIQKAKSRQVWTFTNKILYDLCRKFPAHKADDAIIAKVLIIGRVYAAAIERRHNVKVQGDDFYTKTVAQNIKKSGIDRWLAALPSQLGSDEITTARILETHHKVTDLFSEISDLNKRSLASKYLHFHRPDLFFIYDSRAMAAIRATTTSVRNYSTISYDREYAGFFRRCQWLKKSILERFNTELAPRQLDDLLMIISKRLSN